jgi:putative sterol carrier protein
MDKNKDKLFCLSDNKKFLTQIQKINDKVDLDTEFPDWNKAVQFIIKNTQGEDEMSFYFVVEGGKVAKADNGKLPVADVTIEGNAEAMSNLFDGELPVVGAFITKQLVIKGTVGDAVGVNVLLQAARTF